MDIHNFRKGKAGAKKGSLYLKVLKVTQFGEDALNLTDPLEKLPHNDQQGQEVYPTSQTLNLDLFNLSGLRIVCSPR